MGRAVDLAVDLDLDLDLEKVPSFTMARGLRTMANAGATRAKRAKDGTGTGDGKAALGSPDFRHTSQSGTGGGIPVLLARSRLPAPFQFTVRQDQANHDLKGCLSKINFNPVRQPRDDQA